MKSFASSNDEFYEEEKKAALEESKRRDLTRRQAIPGMIKVGDSLEQAAGPSNGF
jgi:hypothetical protein